MFRNRSRKKEEEEEKRQRCLAGSYGLEQIVPLRWFIEKVIPSDSSSGVLHSLVGETEGRERAWRKR